MDIAYGTHRFFMGHINFAMCPIKNDAKVSILKKKEYNKIWDIWDT